MIGTWYRPFKTQWLELSKPFFREKLGGKPRIRHYAGRRPVREVLRAYVSKAVEALAGRGYIEIRQDKDDVRIWFTNTWIPSARTDGRCPRGGLGIKQGGSLPWHISGEPSRSC